MKHMLCHKDQTLLDALELVQKNGTRAVFVVDDKRALYGILTDGDIRLALLKGAPLSKRVSTLANRNFISTQELKDYTSFVAALEPKINIVPIIDKQKRVVDYLKIDKNIHIPVASPALNGNEFKYLINASLSTWISSTGHYINEFEKNFAKFCGCKYGVAVMNGTTALHLAMVTLGIKAGDEVIVPDLTFAASINTVLHAGATPVVVDIDKDTWTISPQEIERAITPRTKAIMPVHIYGQPCNMTAIMKLARRHKLAVVEDCAEAHGAEFAGKKVGSFGEIGCFSFFANKVITTGEGGMCVTNSKKVYEKLLILRDHGMSKQKKYWHDEVGYNYRMTNMQAAVGCAQLERIKENLAERRRLEVRYKAALKDVSLIKFQTNVPKAKKITWLVSVLVKGGMRDKLLKELLDYKIDARPFFYPLSKMPLYKPYIFSNTNSQMVSVQGINLPTHIGFKESELRRVVKVIKDFDSNLNNEI